MGPRQLRDELVSLLVAGHETTAVALSWAWQLLGAHPDVEERMAHELRVVLGDGPIDPARHASLRYTRCVVQETLRLYPPAWVVPRLAVRPVELDGHRIPPGDVVIVCTHLLHRDPRFWDEPARFDPARFEDGAAGARRHPAYLPFGAGPRSCLGREFALMEATLLLAALARRFRAVPLASGARARRLRLHPAARRGGADAAGRPHVRSEVLPPRLASVSSGRFSARAGSKELRATRGRWRCDDGGGMGLAVFEGTTKRYGGRTVVDDLSFEVAEGSVTGLLGPNGAGKTTAIRMLLGIASVSGGSCALFGAAPGRPGFRAAVRQTGSLIESPSLYGNATALANLKIWAVSRGLSPRDPRIGRVLERVGLAGRGDAKAKDFSLGMRQRLGIGMAILHEPKLVILDEPTNGLDPAGTVEIRELIRSLPAQGATVLVSSHVLGEVQKTVNHVVIIAAGKLRASGPMDELLHQNTASAFIVALPPETLARGRQVLESRGLAVEEIGGQLSVTGETHGAVLSQALAEAGVYPEELHRREESLEETFLQITGPPGGPAREGRAAQDALAADPADHAAGRAPRARGRRADHLLRRARRPDLLPQGAARHGAVRRRDRRDRRGRVDHRHGVRPGNRPPPAHGRARRTHVVANKLLTAAVTILLGSALVALIGFWLGALAADLRDVDYDQGTAGKLALVVAISGLLVGLLSFALGLLAESMAGGIVLAFAVLFVLDGAVSFVESLRDYTFQSALSSIAARFDPDSAAALNLGAAIAVALAWVAVLMVPGVIRFLRSDFK